MTQRRLGLALVVLASCGRSPLPSPEFPVVPAALAELARYGVVTLRESTISLSAAAPGGGVPSIPVLRRTSLTRILVTAEMPPALYNRVIEPTDGCMVTRAQARLASKAGHSVDVDGLAGTQPVPADPAQLGRWLGNRSPIVHLDLPKPAVGELLDFFVERTCTRAFDMVPPTLFGSSMPTLDSRLTVKADPTFKVRLVASHGGDAVSEVPPSSDKGGYAWTLRERDLPAYDDDEFAIDAQHIGPWSQLVIASVVGPRGEQLFAESWGAIAAHVREAAEAASPVGSADADLVKNGSATARLRKLRERMAPREARAPFAPARRYSDIPPNGATPFETAAAIVMASKDAPDHGHLALATLAEGPLLVDDVPSLYPFRAVLVASRANGGWQFDDPTCLNCAPGRLPSDLAGGRALVVTDDGYEITEVPFGATETSRSRLQVGWTLSGDELAGSVLADFEGGNARRLLRLMENATMQPTPDALSALRKELFGAVVGLEVVSVGEASPATARPYEMRFSVSAKTDAANGLMRIPVYRVAGPWVPWLTPITTPRDVVLPGPLRAETTVTITTPKSYSLARLGDINVRKTVGEYQLHVEQRDDVITITRRVGLFTRHVPKERFGELRELVLAAADGDAQVLELNPGR